MDISVNLIENSKLWMQKKFLKECQVKMLDSVIFLLYSSKGDCMERIVEQGLLYDFYGELLTEHQKKIYEDVVYNDLSLSEIAQENGISRQGVHDMVRRCNHMLTEYENKLHLVERFLKIRNGVNEMKHLSENTELTKEEILGRVNSLCCEILKEL